MSRELVKCSCCGEMVPAKNIEISFRRPDDIASLSKDDLNSRCEHDDDTCVLDGERYFVRCTIPLPVQESLNLYAIGAWAEISESSFKKIRKLWSDENQVDEPPIEGNLANDIPLNNNSFGCSVAVRLKGPKTRPEIFIAEDTCSLYKEQASGISLHRASEYSDLLRKDEVKEDVGNTVVEEQELEPSHCGCCDNIINNYCGYITGAEEEILADYWLRIPQGHEGYFTVAVSIAAGGEPRVAVLMGQATNEGITYWVQNKEDSPWSKFGEYGEILDREKVLADQFKGLFFEMADTVAANDSRLLLHTKPYLNAE